MTLITRPISQLRLTPSSERAFPDRYAIRQDDGGSYYLCCLEAPEVKVRVERGMALSAAAARKAHDGAIYLDGAAQGEPFLDLERQVFNLDHHEGCVRAFTLATCEQALVLTLRGLDLRERPWVIYANEPDLDTLLAVWVLLNGMHLAGDDPSIRSTAISLVRLEGVIDAHGLELEDLCGFTDEHLRETSEKLDRLHRAEVELRQEGRWGETDWLEFTAQQLRQVDRIVYPPGHFEDFATVEELFRVSLSQNRIAVACRSERGVYELETDLKRLYGKRLGVIILQKDAKTYTLRQVDPFLPVDLEAAYERLNLLDPAVAKGGPGNRWGGSGEIGGSPRGTGTRLSVEEIADACRRAFQGTTLVQYVLNVVLAALVSAAVVAVGWLALVVRHGQGLEEMGLIVGRSRLELSGAVVAFAALLLSLFARRRPRLFGLRRPAGWDWLLMLPPALLGGLAGGVWTLGVPTALGESVSEVLALLAFPLAAELAFRGLAHGILGCRFSIQHGGGRWFLSWPVVVSALLYTLATSHPRLPLLSAFGDLLPGWSLELRLAGALLFGVAAATARERSGSLAPPLLLHLLSAACLVLFQQTLGG